MVSKKDLKKLKNMKTHWDILDEEYNSLLEKRIKKFILDENIDENKVKEELKKYRRATVVFQNPIVINKCYIGKDFYPKIIIKNAYIFAKEKVPPNCFLLPKIYKTSILKYDEKKHSALLVVVRREDEVDSTDISFTIIKTKFKNIDFKRYPFIPRTNREISYLLRYNKITILEEQNMSTLFYEFLVDIQNTGKISMDCETQIFCEKTIQLIQLMKSKNERLKGRMLEKLYFQCFTKIKEISIKENFDIPDVEWFIQNMKK